MTIAQFFGCTMIAFGPPLSMFVITIARDPVRTIMLVARSPTPTHQKTTPMLYLFLLKTAHSFWLLALLFSSILFMVVTPLKDTIAFGAIFSVLFQELFRFLWFLLIQKAEVGLRKVSEGNIEIVENKHILAYGLYSIIIIFIGSRIWYNFWSFLLSKRLGRHDRTRNYWSKGRPSGILRSICVYEFSFYTVTGILGSAVLQRVAQKNLLAVNLCNFQSSCLYKHLGQLLILFLFFAILKMEMNIRLYVKKNLESLNARLRTLETLLNPFYAVTIPLVWAVTILSGALAFRAVGGTWRSLRNAMKRSPQVVQIQISTSRNSIDAGGATAGRIIY
ncbi:Gamma-secretase subunit Aph-1 [Armadillidium vulgare]|nr:Gamma-secretase subunit Aph-1 [Armadillidium vulgare]